MKGCVVYEHMLIFANMCVCTIIDKCGFNRWGDKIKKCGGFPFHGIKTTIENRFVCSCEARQVVDTFIFVTGAAGTDASGGLGMHRASSRKFRM